MLPVYRWLYYGVIITLLSACQDHSKTPSVEIKPLESPRTTTLALPPLEAKTYTTDHVALLNGSDLYLWQDQGQCFLQINKQHLQALNLNAPCRFVRSPGTKDIQVFKADRTTRVIALVGNVTVNDCGDSARGIIIRGNSIQLAISTLSASTFCTTKGLENAQYALFLKSH